MNFEKPEGPVSEQCSAPAARLRRYRRTAGLRAMFDAALPGPQKFILPVFAVEGAGLKEPISAMPGQFRFGADMLPGGIEPAVRAGVGGVLVFGVASENRKDALGSCAWAEDGPAQCAIRSLRAAFPELVIMSDVCLCAYTDHGHCGALDPAGDVDNDATNKLLARIALSHARAGADVVAPSAMMDGQVKAIRQALDAEGLGHTLIMSYSTKFASSLYGPFREAERSAPKRGDRRGYQTSYADAKLALRESELDEAEGADILMVKPALFYLDIISRLRERTLLPIAAYNVSGEYSMLIAASERGWGELRDMVRESIAAIARAGADLIISYWAARYAEMFGT